MDSIHDMRVVNTDAVSYQSKTPEKCLETAECKKKKNYLKYCLNEHIYFTPFIALVDGLIGVDAEATLKLITICLSQKWKELHSRTCRYLKSRVEINIECATQCCIRGARVTESRISLNLPHWEDGTGLHLFR